VAENFETKYNLHMLLPAAWPSVHYKVPRTIFIQKRGRSVEHLGKEEELWVPGCPQSDRLPLRIMS